MERDGESAKVQQTRDKCAKMNEFGLDMVSVECLWDIQDQQWWLSYGSSEEQPGQRDVFLSDVLAQSWQLQGNDGIA